MGVRPVALLVQGRPARFLGMEINLGEDGASFEVSQKGFIEELLRAHGHKGSKSWSMGPRDQLLLTPEENEELPERKKPRPGRVRLTLQSCARPKGAWVSSYVVALMASGVSKNPKVVNQIGNSLRDYLCQTANYCLAFGGSGKSQMTGSTSHGLMIFEGALLLKSVEGVIQEIAELMPRLTIRVDNMSAAQLLKGPSGSWKTRHLRLRSSWLKEQVSTGQMRVLRAGTNAAGRRHSLQELVALWRLKDSDRKVATLTAQTAQAQLPQSTLTKAECRELSAYCERDPAEPLPPAPARFAELLAKLDNMRAQTQAQASTTAETHQSEGKVESGASASTAPRTAECGVQTDFALGFTRMTPQRSTCLRPQ